MANFWDKVTPWNTKNENSDLRQEEMTLAAELEIKKQQAGIISDNQLSALVAGTSTKTYLIIGIVLVVVVALAVYFKFRK